MTNEEVEGEPDLEPSSWRAFRCLIDSDKLNFLWIPFGFFGFQGLSVGPSLMISERLRWDEPALPGVGRDLLEDSRLFAGRFGFNGELQYPPAG